MMVIWSALFYEYWKRKEASYSVEWGQTEFEEEEIEMASFRGVNRRSPIDDKPEKFFALVKRIFRVSISILVTALLLAIDLAIIYGLFSLRYYLYNRWKDYWYADYSITLVSIINAIVICIFNFIYFYILKFELKIIFLAIGIIFLNKY